MVMETSESNHAWHDCSCLIHLLLFTETTRSLPPPLRTNYFVQVSEVKREIQGDKICGRFFGVSENVRDWSFVSRL